MPSRLVTPQGVFTVTQDREAVKRAERFHKAAVNGDTDFDRLVIAVNPDAGPERKRITLCHEVLHVVNDITGWGYEVSKDQEERFVRRTAPTLLGLMVANQPLVQYLFGPTR